LDGQDDEAALLAIREELSHRLPDPAVWPLFDIRATHHQGGRRLHIGLDLLVLDAASIFQLREEWGRLYENPAIPLPPIGLSFRDFVMENIAWRQSEVWQRSARYWQERLPTLPGAPDLPLARQPRQIDRPRFVRHLATLPAGQWSALQEAAQARGLTPSALLAASYGDILAAFSRTERFCLTLTSFNRPPLHPDMAALIGDFTSTILLEVDTTPASFAERAATLQKRLAEDLDHAEVGGVHVLRELAPGPCRGGRGPCAARAGAYPRCRCRLDPGRVHQRAGLPRAGQRAVELGPHQRHGAQRRPDPAGLDRPPGLRA
ncbi:condensation domain-containing protein, partial [Geminicoccus flavidas]|uniref:condensation domain-containing protein n=1 Tax=Geminicoccus flavidas TaxID=2506407 RepID=UPI001F33D8C2